VTPEPLADVLARVEHAREARARLRTRPLGETVAALSAAAARWCDEHDGAALARVSGLSRPLADAAVDLAAKAIEAEVMADLVEREWGPGTMARPVPEGPALVAHVLASNVPALALPAIVLGCLAGAAVVIKSGRHDPLSAPAFKRALAAVDPDLAATVVTTYWAGGDREAENAVLGQANVAVVTGGDETLRAICTRLQVPILAHGWRTSIAIVGRAGPVDETVDALALDVALHDQRGCLSPHDVWVEGDSLAFAARLAAALETVATRLPPGAASVEERAAVRVVVDEAEWMPDEVTAFAGPWGAVVHGAPRIGHTHPGFRTVRVNPLAEIAALPWDNLRDVECVGVAGFDPAGLVPTFQAHGVSRLCPVGRMQRPPLSWPRGQEPPLGILLFRPWEPEIQVET